MFKIAALIVMLAVALVGASENGSPEPYAYQYNNPSGSHGAAEQSDGSTVTGYYYVNDQENGHQRRVNYIADANGFRANVQSNHEQLAEAHDASHQHQHQPQHQHQHHPNQLQGLQQQQQGAVYKQQAYQAQTVPQQVGSGLYANQGTSGYGYASNGLYGNQDSAGYGYASNSLYANQGVSGYNAPGVGYSYYGQQPYQQGAYYSTASAVPASSGYYSTSRVAPQQQQQQQYVAQGVPNIQGSVPYYGYGVQQPANNANSYYYSPIPAGVNEVAGSRGVSSSQVPSISVANSNRVRSPVPVEGVADQEPQKK